MYPRPARPSQWVLPMASPGPDNSRGTVTVVIAAYQRAEALNKTLASVVRQTYGKWRALVIGDGCPADFFSRVDASDERITLINLPVRCGHQYGPNSVGIHLAQGEYLAYLNHDDLWLSDHLERAVAVLGAGDEAADVYLGQAAFCHAANQPPRSAVSDRPLFSELNRPETLWRCLSGPFYFFEPASAWVIRNDLARRVGYWKAPDEVEVTPVMDWLRRVARAGGRFHAADEVTVLKLNTQPARKGTDLPLYYQGDPELEALDGLARQPPARVREAIMQDLARAGELGLTVRPEMVGPIPMTPEERDRMTGFLLYVQTGLLSRPLVGPPIGPYRSENALTTLTRRTGERFSRFIPVSEILAAVSADRPSGP